MINFLHDIRKAENPTSNIRKIINTIALLFLGIALGTFSKYLDFRQAELPSAIMEINEVLDIGNFLGRFAIWVLIALCISIYSNSAIRASINIFAFFVGMVASYYLYSNYIAGFFSKKLCDDLGRIYSCISIIGFCLLVCKGEKQTGIYTLSADFGSIVQYVFYIWMLVF